MSGSPKDTHLVETSTNWLWGLSKIAGFDRPGPEILFVTRLARVSVSKLSTSWSEPRMELIEVLCKRHPSALDAGISTWCTVYSEFVAGLRRFRA